MYQTTTAGIIDIYSFGWIGNTLVGSSSTLSCSGCYDVSVAVDTAGQVYVLDENLARVLVYPAGANGNASPAYILVGGATLMSAPTLMALDANNYLYVLSIGSGTPNITVYPPGARGNTAALAQVTLPANATALGMTTTPAGQVIVSIDNVENGSTRQLGVVPTYPNFSQGNLTLNTLTDPNVYGPVATDAYGNLLVAENSTKNVGMLTPQLLDFATAPATTGNIEGIAPFVVPLNNQAIHRAPSSTGGHR